MLAFFTLQTLFLLMLVGCLNGVDLVFIVNVVFAYIYGFFYEYDLAFIANVVFADVDGFSIA